MLNQLVLEMHPMVSGKVYSMLRITTEQKRGKVVLQVEGRLAGQWVPALEQVWRDLQGRSPREKIFVNLCGVSFIDASGKVLLKEIHQQGGQLMAEGCLNQSILEEIKRGADKEERPEKEAGDKNAAKDKGKKGPSIIFYIALFSLLGAPTFARAQETPKTSIAIDPSQTLKLTLDQAVNLALKQNTTAQIAVITAAQSVQDKNIARAALLPQADLDVQDSANRVNIRAQFGGLDIPGFPHHVGPYQIFSAGPSFSAPIFDLTLWRRYQSARETANASKATSLSTREQVILLVVSQYIGTLRAVANVQASESRVQLAQALYDQAADLQKEGVGTGIDTLRANVELQNEKQRFIEAARDRETSLYGLSRLLNLNPRQRIELADSLSFFDTPQPEADPSIDAALAQRQEWKSLESQIKAAGADKKASQSSRLPSVHFDGNWAYLGTSSTTGIPTYTYQGSVTMPLFTGGRIRAEVVKADLEVKKLHEQQQDLRNEIALDVKTALLNLQSARSEVEVANLGVELSKEEVDQARDRFRAGVANNIEVIQAQDSLARANDNQIAALYRFNQARADFAKSIGQMEKIYAK